MNQHLQLTPDAVLEFWFSEIEEKFWWIKDEAFDQQIRERFGALHSRAHCCELFEWRATPRGRLAEVIVLDQFSRNMFRGQPGSFASDTLALALAQEAVAAGADRALPPRERTFIYMPYMHSESLLVHAEAVRLFRDHGQPGNYEFEIKHRDIIAKFGRYPHRNGILGRISTPEEVEFLKMPGSSF